MTAWGGKGPIVTPEIRSVDSTNGIALLYRAWEADEPRARVLIVHGLGEHGGRYTALGEALLAHGISSYAPDLRGHGVSGGHRGHVSRFEDYLYDLETIARETAVQAPTILLGQSLGGLIVLRAIQTDRVGPLAAAVLSAPAVEPAGEPSPWLRVTAAVLSRVAPSHQLSSRMDPADMSHDPLEVEAYRTDPLVHDRITPRLYVEMRAAMRAGARDAERVNVPLLLLAPGADRIIRSSAAVAVSARFRGEVQVRSYPDFFHEPFHERERGAVLADVVTWIEEQIR